MSLLPRPVRRFPSFGRILKAEPRPWRMLLTCRRARQLGLTEDSLASHMR